MRNASAITRTEHWFKHIILGQKLCPFALTARLNYRLSLSPTKSGVVAEVGEEANKLRAGLRRGDNQPETTLLVLTDEQYTWPSLLAFSWQLQREVRLCVVGLQDAFATCASLRPVQAIVEPGHAEHLQLVLFHPGGGSASHPRLLFAMCVTSLFR